ncbi:MAG: DUF58 domain-containing protein [Candidatus Bipolaricaulaceae bacterium]
MAELILLIALLGVGMFFGRSEPLLLGILLATHLFWGLALAWRPFRVSVAVTPSQVWATAGQLVKLEVSLINRGTTGVFVQVPFEQFPGPLDPRSSAVWHLESGETAKIVYKLVPNRMYLQKEELVVRRWDVLGFAAAEERIPCPWELKVIPQVEVVPAPPLSPRSTLNAFGAGRSRQGGPAGLVFFGVKPYLPGEDLRRLNWKVLARQGRWTMNLYEEERMALVTVVVDARAHVYRAALASADLFEAGVRASASLARALLQRGHRTGLLAVEERLRWVPPGVGRRHWERLALELAAVTVKESEAFPTLKEIPLDFFPRGSAIILVSPLSLDDARALWLWKGQGYEVLVLVLSPPRPAPSDPHLRLSFRILALEERLKILELMASGIRVALWDGEAPLAAVLRRSSWP